MNDRKHAASPAAEAQRNECDDWQSLGTVHLLKGIFSYTAHVYFNTRTGHVAQLSKCSRKKSRLRVLRPCDEFYEQAVRAKDRQLDFEERTKGFGDWFSSA